MATVNHSEAAPFSASKTKLPSLSTRQKLGVILLGHLILALLYSMTIPAWEAHDEWAHFRYAAYIAETHTLPSPHQRLNNEFPDDEASQPPLYYILAAAPMLFIDTQDGYSPQVNQYLNGENAQTGVNVVIHQPKVEKFPWHGTMLAMHLGRLVSIFISTLALIVTYNILRYLTPERPEVALLGTAIQAFAPQFVFLSAVLTNDILAITMGAILLYLMLRLIEEGPKPGLVATTSLAAGLTMLTKYVGIAILPLIPVAFVWGAWRHRRDPNTLRQFMLSAIIIIVPALLLSGGMLWRNHAYTGKWIPRDVVTQKALLSGLQTGQTFIDIKLVWPALKYGFITYWASFGWGNLSPQQWFYVSWLLIIIVALIGILLWLIRERPTPAWHLTPFLLLFTLMAVGVPLVRELTYNRPFLRGRLLLSTIPITGWVIAAGWTYLSRRFWRWTHLGISVWTAGLSIYLLFFLIAPHYQPPKALAVAPELPIPINIRFGDAAELLSAEIWPTESVKAEQGMAVTLAWRVIAPTVKPYALSIYLVGPGGQPYGGMVSYPGYGKMATNVWPSGYIFKETYWFIVTPNGPTPASGVIQVKLFNPRNNPKQLPTYDSRGNPIGESAIFGSVRIDPAWQHVSAQDDSFLATFEHVIALERVNMLPEPQYAGDVLPIWLQWQALGPGPADLTLSIQLLDEDNTWIAGNDGPVSDVLRPEHWRQGDALDTIRWLSLPDDLAPGTYRLMATIYRFNDLTRLAGVDAAGASLPDNMYLLTEITVQ